jgi:hypothetical protein
MNNFFCADHSRCLDEMPIGTARPYSTYVLIECPTPWAATAGESQGIPPILSQTMQAIAKQDPSVRFLLINRNRTQLLGCRSVIIYRARTGDVCGGYDKYEFVVNGLGEAAMAIQNFFEGRWANHMIYSRTEDVLICTHGSHDQCCARYGNPFYAEAKQVVKTISGKDAGKDAGKDIRVWRSSHFGGHRFAPTALTFPDGRCYARLDAVSLRSILSRTGDINPLLRSTYRGWGILPEPLQIMEQAMLQQFGWQAMGWPIAYQINQALQAQLRYSIDGAVMTCNGDLSLDADRTVELLGSCHAEKPSVYPKYKLDRLEIIPAKQLVMAV